MRTATPAILLAGLLLSTAACTSTDDFVFRAGIWVAIDPIQCDGNAWDTSGLTVEAYYQSLGVEVITSVTIQVADNVCLACSCPTGFRVYLEVDQNNLTFMLGEGFTQMTPP